MDGLCLDLVCSWSQPSTRSSIGPLEEFNFEDRYFFSLVWVVLAGFGFCKRRRKVLACVLSFCSFVRAKGMGTSGFELVGKFHISPWRLSSVVVFSASEERERRGTLVPRALPWGLKNTWFQCYYSVQYNLHEDPVWNLRSCAVHGKTWERKRKYSLDKKCGWFHLNSFLIFNVNLHT